MKCSSRVRADGPAYWLTLDGMLQGNPHLVLLGFMGLCTLVENGAVGARIVYNDLTRALEEDGRLIDDESAEMFIRFLGLREASPLWATLGVAEASNLTKLGTLLDPLARGEDAWDLTYHPDDPGYVPA